MKHSQKEGNLAKGALGEELACRFLMKRGYSVMGRNFRRKCGEIDIVASKTAQRGSRLVKTLHFIEVKSVSCVTSHRPEENMHRTKLKRFSKTVQLYLLANNVPHETPFQIDGITVYLDHVRRRGRVCLIENINT